jgi:hypothetical protein
MDLTSAELPVAASSHDWRGEQLILYKKAKTGKTRLPVFFCLFFLKGVVRAFLLPRKKCLFSQKCQKIGSGFEPLDRKSGKTLSPIFWTSKFCPFFRIFFRGFCTSEMARAGAGAGDSSAVREASRGIKASDDADPCPLWPRASGVTAASGTRPCCSCPGRGSRQGARIPATTRGGRAVGPAPGRPPLAVGLARRFPPLACQGPPPARSYGRAGLGPRPRILRFEGPIFWHFCGLKKSDRMVVRFFGKVL